MAIIVFLGGKGEESTQADATAPKGIIMLPSAMKSRVAYHKNTRSFSSSKTNHPQMQDSIENINRFAPPA